ncbi:MFS general substrate transporter [Auriculariales sp. MPI-PUGE-AT-0066]|nr:MFS general substrate transporter [Auriculariales sp. MPI-PUGE-AT-0066]
MAVEIEKARTPSFSKGSEHSITAEKASDVDVTVALVAGDDGQPISPEDSRRIRRKLDLHLLPVLFLLYVLQFIDKSSLAASSVLGVLEDAHLNIDQFNNAASAFYIGYLVFEWPQQWALQRFPVAKWISFNVFLWAVFLGLQPLCKSFGPLWALRFLLGASEGAVTAGLMIMVSMFYTRIEIGERIGWTLQCNGIAQIINGFISFGVAHVKATAKPRQWQWQMIITSILSLIVGTIFLAFFPDNPAKARFLSQEEKVLVVKRVSENQNGIETKKFKKAQFIEALRDPKTWLFFLFAAVSNLQNGNGAQYSLIIKDFGFTKMQSTILNIPSGFSQICGITLGCWLLRKFPNSRAWLAMIFFVPSLLAAILEITLTNKIGKLVAFYFYGFGGAPSFAFVMSWVTSTTAGHTKRLTVNGLFLIGYALGQFLCTQFWRAKYKPRNIVPWSICIAVIVCDFIILMALRMYLNGENKRRDALQAGRTEEDIEDERWGYVEIPNGPDGVPVKQRVDKSLLDITDRENLSFRYCL